MSTRGEGQQPSHTQVYSTQSRTFVEMMTEGELRCREAPSVLPRLVNKTLFEPTQKSWRSESSLDGTKPGRVGEIQFRITFIGFNQV